MLKILVIDDHPLVAEGIASLLSAVADDVSVSTVQGGMQGIDRAVAEQPDLILLDLYMPGLSGFEAMRILGDKLPTCSIVIVSSSLDMKEMKTAMSLGAMGFIPKSASPEVMINALKLVISGSIYVPPEMLGLGANESTATLPDTAPISPRQLEVLKLMAEGKSNKEISSILGCAETTVKTHVTALFKELGARNRTEAVIVAQKRKLLSD